MVSMTIRVLNLYLHFILGVGFVFFMCLSFSLVFCFFVYWTPFFTKLKSRGGVLGNSGNARIEKGFLF